MAQVEPLVGTFLLAIAKLGLPPIKERYGHLGPEPPDPRERWQWDEEWRGAVVLLAALADYDATALRRAALDVAEDLADRMERALLLEAAEIHR